MAANAISEKLISQYLLGELSEDQQVEIEDRAFADEEFMAGITAVENDLIDEYVRGQMSDADRRRFESRFLNSESRRKRIEFAKALTHLLAETRVTGRDTRKAGARGSWRAQSGSAAVIVLAVAKPAVDTDRSAVPVHDDDRVHAVALAHATEVFHRLARAICSRQRHRDV